MLVPCQKHCSNHYGREIIYKVEINLFFSIQRGLFSPKSTRDQNIIKLFLLFIMNVGLHYAVFVLILQMFRNSSWNLMCLMILYYWMIIVHVSRIEKAGIILLVLWHEWWGICNFIYFTHFSSNLFIARSLLIKMFCDNIPGCSTSYKYSHWDRWITLAQAL